MFKNSLIVSAIICSVLVATDAFAAKLYKIVDENGNVTFSQFPPSPAEKEENLIVEETSVQASETAVVRKGDTLYCGDIALPNESISKDYYHSEIASKLKYWKSDLERREEMHQREQESYLRQAQQRSNYPSQYRSNQSSYQTSRHMERSKEMLSNIRDLKCAIKWGTNQQLETQDAKEEMNKELKRLQNILDTLHVQQTAECGNEPIYDPTIDGNDVQRRAFSRCSSKFRKDIRNVESLIRTESRKLERF